MGLSAGSLFWNILTVDIFSIWSRILLTFFLGPDGFAKAMGLSSRHAGFAQQLTLSPSALSF